MTRNIVLSTCGSVREARRIAKDLVQKKLAACVNITPVTSLYRWKGKMVDEREWLMIIKTRSNLFPKLKRRILELHSYEVPEVVSLRIYAGHEAYLAWLDSETG